MTLKNQENKDNYKNVTSSVSDSQCKGCTICSGICPVNALDIKEKNGFFRPFLKEGCIDCGKCLVICPALQRQKKDYYNENMSIYGYSMNPELRKNASSGGLLTELLCYLIDKKIVDRVSIISSFKSSDNKPKANLSNNIKEIMNATGSKYCPVDYSHIISEIKNSDESFCLVGLPCQIQAIRLYMNLNKVFANKVNFLISLFCNHVPSFNAFTYLKKGLDLPEKGDIIFRGKGWPGFMQLRKKTGETLDLPFRLASGKILAYYFKQDACFFCKDPFGAYADASFADAYFLPDHLQLDGQTFTIIRNNNINIIFRKMQQNHNINFILGLTEHLFNKTYAVLHNRIYKKEFQIREKKLLNLARNPDQWNVLRKETGFFDLLQEFC